MATNGSVMNGASSNGNVHLHEKAGVVNASGHPTKYVVVTGGVVSGLGKGVTASSIGALIKARGFRVTSIKIDPYLNIDAGTMSPFEHGEVYVLDDGGEVDLDLGNYERFMDITLQRDNNITTGKIYQSVLEKERRGSYLGKTVQVVPHVTDEIQNWIERVARLPSDGSLNQPDVCVIELGGTVGDIESMPFVEALRQFQWRVGNDNFCLIHLSLVPVLGVVGEQKTKPTQHSVQVLRSYGLHPNMLCCRATTPLETPVKEKLAQFCQVNVESVMSIHDVSNIWHVPLILEDQCAAENVLTTLKLPLRRPQLDSWRALAKRWDSVEEVVTIAVVGKYTGLTDSYLSVIKALTHASIAIGYKLKIEWIESTTLEDANAKDDAFDKLKSAHGVLVPGGFGFRGTEGMIKAIEYARQNNVPLLGICLGMQLAVIEYARHVLKLEDAGSAEFDPVTRTPAIIFMPEGSKTHKGGTMRLGNRRTVLSSKTSICAQLYETGQEGFVDERHRHRYEVNPELVADLTEKGMHFVGKDETGCRMEVIELDREDHPFFLGVQFHPEFKSRPGKPSPCFLGLLLAATGNLASYVDGNFDGLPSMYTSPVHIRNKRPSLSSGDVDAKKLEKSRVKRRAL